MIRTNKSNYLILLLIILFITSTPNQASAQNEYNVAIFLYDGVELLDFAGPGEVFGATSGFNVYTVSIDGEPILSQGYVTVDPEYAMKDAPRTDILVFPGGGSRATAENQKVLNWIQANASDGAINMSVCTGARILASAGVLDGLKVTTWYGFTGGLQELLPNSEVLENTRFVDSGNILTTAGVSAGIDGALHLVSRIKGKDVAEGTAKYMEYDKWNPDDGLIDYKNPLIEAIRNQGLDQALESVRIDFSSGIPSFYEGEMKNFGFEYVEQEQWKQAEEVFKLVIKYYPSSIASYETLSAIYEKLGKYVPLKEQKFINMVMEGKIDEAITRFRETREAYPNWMVFRESYVNWAGYQYLQKKQFEQAITLFKLNAEVYPESANVYDSLGEAYVKNGQPELAEENYRKALAIDPGYESAIEALKKLGGS